MTPRNNPSLCMSNKIIHLPTSPFPQTSIYLIYAANTVDQSKVSPRAPNYFFCLVFHARPSPITYQKSSCSSSKVLFGCTGCTTKQPVRLLIYSNCPIIFAPIPFLSDLLAMPFRVSSLRCGILKLEVSIHRRFRPKF